MLTHFVIIANNGASRIDANPYEEETKHQQWDEGWEDAKMDTDLNRRSICSEHEAAPS